MKFKNFILISHWRCVIVSVDKTRSVFTADVKRQPLDKKKNRLNPIESSDGWVEMAFDAVEKCDEDKITLGQIFDWYVGYSSNRYENRIPTSKVVFMKKYGKEGKRINVKEAERRAKRMFDSIKWD